MLHDLACVCSRTEHTIVRGMRGRLGVALDVETAVDGGPTLYQLCWTDA